MAESLRIQVATVHQVRQIVELSNEAFLADAYFKKPEHHLRFSEESVSKMIEDLNSAFLLCCDSQLDNTLVGSLYLQWEVQEDADYVKVKGKFSAVAVPPRFERRGIGQALVRSAENQVIKQAEALEQSLNKHSKASMEMAVVNVREVLFPWYGKQGYAKLGDIRPNPPGFDALLLDEMKEKVCLVLMEKVLKE